jgi:hypothetical protein
MIERVKEARFANAGVANHGSDLELAVFERDGALFLQPLQFGIAPDHAGLNPLHASTQQLKHAWFELVHPIRRRRFAPSLAAKGFQFFHLEQASKLAIGVVGN